MLQPVSKSVTSALIGIAIGRGEIESVDERVLDFFEDHTGIDNLDARTRAQRPGNQWLSGIHRLRIRL